MTDFARGGADNLAGENLAGKNLAEMSSRP
jgi:hypothetical protein